jgi:hypothetical protein
MPCDQSVCKSQCQQNKCPCANTNCTIECHPNRSCGFLDKKGKNTLRRRTRPKTTDPARKNKKQRLDEEKIVQDIITKLSDMRTRIQEITKQTQQVIAHHKRDDGNTKHGEL